MSKWETEARVDRGSRPTGCPGYHGDRPEEDPTASTPGSGMRNMFHRKEGTDGRVRGRGPRAPLRSCIWPRGHVPCGPYLRGSRLAAPKTRFSRERLDCSGPASGPPLPSQDPLPGRVKLKGGGLKREKQCEESDGAVGSAPPGRQWDTAR